jgi:hypothetical protein
VIMREFADQKALQDYVKLHDLVYLWEGTRPFAMRFAQLSPEQCEVVDVRTKRGVTRALLFPKALLRAEWKADAPPREVLAMKRRRKAGGHPPAFRARNFRLGGVMVQAMPPS